jgi:uncharacterized protein (DUF1697 family)
VATYIGFLRAINLGAKRKFPKAAIAKAVEDAGFTGVETYINTGNVRFDTRLRSRAKIEAALEKAFLAEAGFEVPTIVFTQAELREIAEHAASLGHGGKHYVSLLKQAPTEAAVRAAPSTCCWARTTTRPRSPTPSWRSSWGSPPIEI